MLVFYLLKKFNFLARHFFITRFLLSYSFIDMSLISCLIGMIEWSVPGTWEGECAGDMGEYID